MQKILRKTLITLGLIMSVVVYAQAIPDPVSLVASPSSPSPHQNFTVQAATPSFDKDTAYFSWTIEGKDHPELSGFGKNSMQLVSGDVGSATRISVKVSRPNNLENSLSLVVRVSDLALTWSAETYVPAWYKGKALPVQNSVVDVVAVPTIVQDGTVVRPEDLIYRWTLDDQDNALVGIGKNVFRVQTSDRPDTSYDVRVTVQSPDKSMSKDGQLFIVPSSPHVVVYPATPLGGAEYRTNATVVSTNKRGLIDFFAEAFFFPVVSKRNLFFHWNANGQDISGTPENPNILTLDTSGIARTIPLSVSVGKDEAGAIARSLTLILQ